MTWGLVPRYEHGTRHVLSVSNGRPVFERGPPGFSAPFERENTELARRRLDEALATVGLRHDSRHLYRVAVLVDGDHREAGRGGR